MEEEKSIIDSKIAELKGLVERAEQLKAEIAIGGRAEAGHVEEKVDPEKAEQDKLKEIYKGSVLEPYL